MFALLSLTLGTALAQDPDPVDAGLGILITQDGLQNLNTLATAIPIDSLIVDDMSVRECYGLLCWTCLEEYAFAISDMWVDLGLNSLEVDTSSGLIDLNMNLSVQINDASDRFSLYYELLCAGTTCPSYVDPFLASVRMPLSMAVIEKDGVPFVDVTVESVTVSYDLSSEDIHMDCSLGGFEDFLNLLGLSVYDWILSLIAPELQAAIADIGPELETALEDAIASATVDTTIDALGTELSIQLLPSEIAIGPLGVEVWLDSQITAEPAVCVEGLDAGDFRRTESVFVGASDLPAGIHAGLTLTDDMVNQVLYAAWRGGLLCLDIDSELAGGFAIDTSLLDLLVPGAFDGLFDADEPGALIIATAPQTPPLANFTGGAAIGIDLDRFGLDLIAELDDRAARVLGAELEAPVTLPLTFDGTTGELAAEIGMDPDLVEVRVMANEISLSSAEDLSSVLTGTLGGLMETVLGSAVPPIAFTLPAFEGVGAQDIIADSLGTDQETLGVLVQAGPVTYESMGCDDLTSEDGGCGGCEGDSGCGGGCSTASGQSRLIWLTMMPLLVALRRRD
jgi:hypothetical protein